MRMINYAAAIGRDDHFQCKTKEEKLCDPGKSFIVGQRSEERNSGMFQTILKTVISVPHI